jgi:hypothetical protein
MISAFIFVSSFEFESRKIKILNKWLMEMQLPCFHKYFCNQWLSSPFTSAFNADVRCELCDSVIHFRCMRPALRKLVKDKTNKNKTFKCEVCT